MSYKVTRSNESVTYEAAGHYDVRTTRLHDSKDVDGCITVGLSHFLPGGGAEMAKSPKELIYYIVEGEMTITTSDGKKHRLLAGDSIHLSPNEGRSSKNTGSKSSQMLVISYLK